MPEHHDPVDAILIAEDDPTSRAVIRGTVSKLGYQPVAVADGMQAWEALCSEDAPSIALLDWEMPGLSGLELIRKVRAEMQDRIIYIIMVTAKRSQDEVIEGIEQGADDYVTKPFDRRELGVRIRAGQRIVQLQRKLLEANHRLEVLAKTDPLTGLANRLALTVEFRARFSGQDGRLAGMAFIMADIDHFKQVNDSHGHDAGDVVLKEVADRIRSRLPHGDMVCRMGGEEFLIIASETADVDGVAIAERLRVAIGGEAFSLPDGTSMTVTCSFGVSRIDGTVSSSLGFDDLVRNADRALFQSKKNGRDRVTLHPGDEPGG